MSLLLFFFLSFFFFAIILNIFKYMWILVFLFLTLIFVSKPGFGIFGNGISTEVISSTKWHRHQRFSTALWNESQSCSAITCSYWYVSVGKNRGFTFSAVHPVYVSVPQADFCGFCKNTSGVMVVYTTVRCFFLLSNSQTSNFSFLIVVYTVCLHNPMPSFTIPSLHILYLIGSLPLSHLLVGCVKLGGFRLLIKDNGVDTFHTNGFLMGFSSSPG